MFKDEHQTWTRTRRIIKKHFCKNPPTILLLGQSGSVQSPLVHTFDFVINRTVNENATRTEAGNRGESHSAKLIMYTNLYKDWYNLRDSRRVYRRGPMFLDSQGLPKRTELVRPIVMMLASGFVPVETNLSDIYKDFTEAIENACDKEQVMKEKIEFYKNKYASAPTEETKPHIVLLVWSAEDYKQLLHQLSALNDALNAAEGTVYISARTTELVVSFVYSYLDLKWYLLFTFDDVLEREEKEKLKNKVIRNLPSVFEVLFVTVKQQLEVIEVFEVVLGGYKPPDDDDKIVRLKRAITEISDETDDVPDGKQDEVEFLRDLKNSLNAPSLPVIKRNLSQLCQEAKIE